MRRGTAETIFNDATKDILEKAEALKKHVKTVTMPAESLAATDVDFLKTLVRHGETRKHLNTIIAHLILPVSAEVTEPKADLETVSMRFWHSEGWTPRNEALMEAATQARAKRQRWLVACDANMDPQGFRRSRWFKETCMFSKALEAGVSTSRSTGPKGELTEPTYDFVIANEGVQ